MERPFAGRGSSRSWRSVFVLSLGVSCLIARLLINPSQAFAADPTLNGALAPTITSGGSVPGITPAALGKFPPGTLNGLSFNFGGISGCIGAQASSLVDIIANRNNGAGGSGAAGGACSTPTVPDSKLTCDAITLNGSVDASRVTSKMKELTDAEKTIQSCILPKLKSVSAQTACLSSQMQALNDFLNTSKARYSDAINTAKQNLTQIDTIIDSRNSQLDTINQRLNGGKDGSDGLRQVAKLAKEYIGGAFPGAILNITQAQATINKQTAALAELRKTEAARVAASCFRQEVSRSDFRCGRTSSDKPVSAYDFIVCRVGQNSFIGKNGQIEQSADRTALAGKNASGIQTVLDAILRDMPIPQALPGGNALVPNADRVLSPSDIDRLYGSQLRSFNVPGFNTYDIVMKSLTACYNEAQNDIVVLEQKPGEVLYENAFALKNLQSQQASAIDTLLPCRSADPADPVFERPEDQYAEPDLRQWRGLASYHQRSGHHAGTQY